MKNPNTTNDGASYSSLKSHSKYTKIFWFLKVVPHLEFSSTRIINITPEYLSILVDFIHKGGTMR